MRTAIVCIVLASCVSAPEDESEVQQDSTTAFANDKAAYDFFVAKGLTNFQAAGIVGNLDQESGVDPNSVQYGGGPGRGIAQWSVGGRWDTSHNDNAVSYAAQQGEGVHTLNLQLEFIWYEMSSVGYGFSDLKATTNVTDATISFMSKYEICGTCASSQRVSYAKAVLTAYGAAPNYAGAYVSQSWPLASQPAVALKCGDTLDAQIKLKNTGAKPWNDNTKLGTTMARDRASIFTGSDWLADNRAATAGTVAVGATGTFAFKFHGPTGAACVPGTYHEHFGLVQEGVSWFSDNGMGGPADDQIEALIDLQPGDPGSGGGSDGSGSGSDDGSMDPANAAGGCSTGSGGTFGLAFGVLVIARRRRS